MKLTVHVHGGPPYIEQDAGLEVVEDDRVVIHGFSGREYELRRGSADPGEWAQFIDGLRREHD